MKKLTIELIEEVARDCERMVESVGFTTPKIKYIINDRSKKFWGRARQIGRNEYQVEIGKFLMEEYVKQNDLTKLYNTICHEICHCLPNGMNHGKVWKGYTGKLNEVYKLGITTKSMASEKVAEEIAKKSKYTLTCRTCGHKYYYQKAGKVVQNYQACSCGKCKGKLDLTQNY